MSDQQTTILLPVSDDPRTQAQVAAVLLQQELRTVARVIDRLTSEGWLVCPPGHVPMPRDRKEAQGMNLISERWLKDNPA